jgi:hypothetical protein
MAKDEKKEETGTYEVVSGFCIGDGENVWPGQVIELPESQGRRWMGRGYVEKTDKKVCPAPKPPHRKDGLIRHQDPKGVRNQDPK